MTTTQDQVTTSAQRPVHVALLGNPNTGKSTLFNRLTGIHQRVGNYPGVTVEKKLGTVGINGKPVTFIDLPGTYSLAAESADEKVVLDVLNGLVEGIPKPDIAVCVVDATNVKRNLFLASQVAESGIPMVIALNMTDEAKKQGFWVDAAKLSLHTGVPVVNMVASKSQGLRDLKAAIENVSKNKQKMVTVEWPNTVHDATQILKDELNSFATTQVTDLELRRMLFDEDTILTDRFNCSEDIFNTALEKARGHMVGAELHPSSAEAVLQYAHIDTLIDGVIEKVSESKRTITQKVDFFLTNRFLGLIFFLLIMFVVFQSIYTWAGPAMDLIESLTGLVAEPVAGLLEATPTLQSLVVDGIIAGIGSVVVFLPQILILFFFISLLEDSGYMARAAFLMDKLFSWCGLNGRCFVPMLSSYACAIPGIIGTRTIADPKARIATIFVAPLMSCSARLPVYVLLISAFIEPYYGPTVAALTMLAMHLVGLMIALPIAFIVNRIILKTKAQPFVMEMPPYRRPQLRDVIWRMWHRGKSFLKDAGTIIFAMSIIIWAMLYFPHGEHVAQETTKSFITQVASDQNITKEQVIAQLEAEDSELADRLDRRISAAYVEQSIMGRIGKTVQPIFAPAGYDWKITVGILSSFPAREVIIATLGIIYELGDEVDEESDSLKDSLKASTWQHGERKGEPVFTPLTAIGLMVFFALCAQCGATIAVAAREATTKLAIIMFFYMTILAWIGAVAVYQIGSLFV